MLLPWVMNYNTMRLTCKITDNLEYEAFDGGYTGYTKTYKGTVTRLDGQTGDWEKEKRWISDNYSHIVGEYCPGSDKIPIIDKNGYTVYHHNGTDPDGGRYDHMQRSAALMMGEDCAFIGIKKYVLFETPDQGLTIFRRSKQPGEKTFYLNKEEATWTEHPQPCHMQPWIQGRKISSYDELIVAGIHTNIIDRCKQGKFDPPPRPDLQKYYVYPIKQQFKWIP